MPPPPNFSSSARALARIGRVVQDKYRITRLVGVGGMASVYAASHRNGFRVAIKYLHDHLSEDASIRHLFTREAYIANAVDHPGAVPVLDDDVDEQGCAFLIMPMLEGETLRARWERKGGHLPLAEVGVLMLDVLDVLACAHAHGIVHRDIKPDNLFITTDGAIRVLDFGIARHLDRDGSATLTGPIVGTPAFMAPEQAVGNRNEIGPASDCWAVGATMFTLLSGEFVHVADSAAAQLAAAATRRARSLSDTGSSVPAPIHQFVDQSLAFEPANRWPSAAPMREALLDVLNNALGQSVPNVALIVRKELAQELSPQATDLRAQETVRSPANSQKHIVLKDEPQFSAQDRISNQPIISSTPRHTPANRETKSLSKMGDKRWHIAPGPLRVMTTVLLSMVALLVAVTYARRRPQESGSSSTNSQPSGSAPASKGTSSDISHADLGFHDSRPPPPDAIAAYNAGVQAWRDASTGPALEHFEQATKIHPAFAAAHLRAALVVFWPDASASEHYQTAVEHRRDLSDADKALLDAVAPLMRVPMSQRECERRLFPLASLPTQDPLVPSLLAHTRIRIGDLDGALDAIAPAIETAPSIASNWRMQGLALAYLDQRDAAEQAFKTCTEVAPSATSCFAGLSDFAANEGDCELAVKYGRQLLAISPSSPSAARHLARAVYATLHSTESARAILQRSWRPPGEPGDHALQFHQEVSLCVLSGDFRCVRSKLDEWKRNVDNVLDEASHMMFTRASMFFDYEIGNDAAILAMAKDYQNHRAAWRPGSYFNHEIIPHMVLYFTGMATREEYHRQRDAWLEAEASRETLIQKSKRWDVAFARAVRDEQDAKEALATLPEYLPLPGAHSRMIETDEGLGRTYLLTGDLDNAEKYLRRAARACTAIENPFEHTWALLEYGRVLERRGDTTGACKFYREVTQRWSEGRTSKLARSRLLSLKCNNPSPQRPQLSQR